jgi:cell division protein FtsB
MARRRPLRQSDGVKTPAPAAKFAPPTLKTQLLFLAIALYLGGTVFKLCIQEWNLYKQAQILQAEKAEVQAQGDQLAAEIARSRTNAGIERLAREQLGLVMAEEIPVKTVAALPPAETIMPEAAKMDVPAGKPAGQPPAMAALAKLFTPPWK